jgi:hypothetical protein
MLRNSRGQWTIRPRTAQVALNTNAHVRTHTLLPPLADPHYAEAQDLSTSQQSPVACRIHLICALSL